jgi:hypothetical protein
LAEVKKASDEQKQVVAEDPNPFKELEPVVRELFGQPRELEQDPDDLSSRLQ